MKFFLQEEKFMSDVREQKKILRKEIATKREELSKAERDKLSHEVVQKFLQTSFYANAKSIMAYASMPEEIQLNELFDDAFAKEKKMSIPFIVGRGTMRPVWLPSKEVLEVGDFGILTVRKDLRKFTDIKELDCVIVPGAAFDLKGNRLGKGGSYYDKFLKLAVNAKKVALAFDFQIMDEVPIEPHDTPVDLIITPTKIISAGE